MTDVDALYREQRDVLLGYFLRRVDDPADAADLLAEVFVVALRRPERIPNEARLWLFGVARNVLHRHRRNASSRARLAVRLAEQLTEQYIPHEDDLLVREALAGFPPRDRELLELLVYDGLTPKEAAEVLGLSAVAARVRLHRIRQRFDGASRANTTWAADLIE